MDLCCLQDVLQSQMGMQLADMQRYSQLTPVQQAQSALPGAHLPAKGFYLIKPLPVPTSSKSLAKSPSLLFRLSRFGSLSPTHSSQRSFSSIAQSADDSSFHSNKTSGTGQEDSTDVVVDIDDMQAGH